MRHLPDLQRVCISDDSPAQLLAQLQSDALMRESLALLPPVLLIALLHVHTQVGWEMCFAAVRQLNNDHGRHVRELSTALSVLRSLRGTRILDPLVWHAAARRLAQVFARELHALHAMPAHPPRHVAFVQDTQRDAVKCGSAMRTLRRSREWLEWSRYWLAASASEPLTWL
jgi:hypothetical protein